jgi:hypothetical protein
MWIEGGVVYRWVLRRTTEEEPIEDGNSLDTEISS